MYDRYNRQNFMPIVFGGDNLERDLVVSNWDLFEINRSISFDNIKRIDVGRPDLLSLRIYGTMSYFWILAKVNNLDDLFNDMVVGMDIIVPDVGDIRDWVLRSRSRMRK